MLREDLHVHPKATPEAEERIAVIKSRIEALGWELVSDSGWSGWIEYARKGIPHPDDGLWEPHIDFDDIFLTLEHVVPTERNHYAPESYEIVSIASGIEGTKAIIYFEIQTMLSFMKNAEEDLLNAGVPFWIRYGFVSDCASKSLKNLRTRAELGMSLELEKRYEWPAALGSALKAALDAAETYEEKRELLETWKV